jgi:uncharacterized protein involved in exopolysaccharide biosynthesis
LRTPVFLCPERLFAAAEPASLSAQFGNEWPAVNKSGSRSEVEQQLAREEETVNRIQSDYQVAQPAPDAARRPYRKGRSYQLNQDSIQYNILQREVDTNRQLYEELLQGEGDRHSAGMRPTSTSLTRRTRRP